MQRSITPNDVTIARQPGAFAVPSNDWYPGEGWPDADLDNDVNGESGDDLDWSPDGN